MILQKWNTLLHRADFRAHPARAVAKRLWWRARWAALKEPLTLRLDDGSLIATHRSGAGALIFYQQTSEPDTRSFLNAFLRPGMVFIDAGAHLGEFTLRASRLVGPKGEVHAFEPAPGNFTLLVRSVALNEASNVILNQAALFDSDGQTRFRLHKEPSLHSIATQADSRTDLDDVIPVSTVCLHTYWGNRDQPIDLVKVDVEGAELSVLKGASQLASRPHWIWEYSPSNYSRFGYGPDEICLFFHQQGYSLWTWNGLDCVPFDLSAAERNTRADHLDTLNLVASPTTRPPLCS